jgi:hypothetical protein
MPKCGQWLSSQGIDYVLWYRTGDTPELWATINGQMGRAYAWTDILTYPEEGRRVGFWKRIVPAAR